MMGLSGLLAACSDDPAIVVPPPAPVTVTVTSAVAPAFVAFRDGDDSAAWQAATKKSPTSYELVANGPYEVTVVCETVPGAVVQTWQAARTPKDPIELKAVCDPVPADHKITGHMVQAGHVQLGDSLRASATAGWDFELSLPSGTYDLVAASADRFAVRRGVAVTGDAALATPIDITTEGSALSAVAFQITNPLKATKAEAAEALEVSVNLATKATPEPVSLFTGAPQAAKVAPAAALTADDVQTVTLQGSRDNFVRSLTVPYKAGGATDFELPVGVSSVAWSIDRDRVSVIANQTPVFEVFTVSATGTSTDGKTLVHHAIDISSSYVAATGLARPILENDMAGYKPEWRLDTKQPYTAEFVIEHTNTSDQLERESASFPLDAAKP
jgi:hypothetical protein